MAASAGTKVPPGFTLSICTGGTSPAGMSTAVWSRGGSISHLLGGAFPILGAGLGLGVASEGSPGTTFCCYFTIIVFLQSHSGCTWSRGPWVTGGDNRC